MYFLYLSLFLISSLSALSSLPYVNLSTKLMSAKENLQLLSTKETLTVSQINYVNECKQLNKYTDTILKDSDVNKQEAKLYLKKLRKLDETYGEVLVNSRADAKKSISRNDYASFINIVESDLPDLFEKPSFTQSAIKYYELNSKIQKSPVMQREIKYDKAKKRASEENKAAIQDVKSTQVKQNQQSANTYQTTPNILPKELKYIKTAYLDPKLFAKREQAFTPWISKREYQSRFDNGYYKQKGVYPAYIEIDANGNRRVLEIAYEPKFYWSCTSGRFFNKFKKIHLRHTLNGKQLFSMHIIRVDGVKVYTGVWLSREQISRERNKLIVFGVHQE